MGRSFESDPALIVQPKNSQLDAPLPIRERDVVAVYGAGFLGQEIPTQPREIRNTSLYPDQTVDPMEGERVSKRPAVIVSRSRSSCLSASAPWAARRGCFAPR